MDTEPVQINQEEQRPIAGSPEPGVKKSRSKPLLVIMAVLFIVAVAAAGYLGWQYKQKRDDNKSLQSRITTLTKQLDDKNKELAAEKQKEAAASSTATSSSSSATLAALKENITAALNSKNTAALQGYMASSVTFVLAATEYGPTETAAKAVTDLTSHTSSATTPWNFDLPAVTLSSYAAGDYHQYFGSGAIVGKSANNYVVSFTLNSSGKISTVFVSASADLL